MKIKPIAIVIGFTILTIWRASAAAVIDTTAGWGGEALSISVDQRYAQTFELVGGTNVLTSVSFQTIDLRWPGDPGYGVPYTFQLTISEWSNGPVGTALYAGIQANPVYLDWNTLTFDTGAVSLLTGHQYAMILSVSTNPEDPEWTSGDVSYSPGDVYPDGGLYWFDPTIDSTQWHEFGFNGDLAFKATLTTVPIPASIWLLVGGLMSIAAVTRKGVVA